MFEINVIGMRTCREYSFYCGVTNRDTLFYLY